MKVYILFNLSYQLVKVFLNEKLADSYYYKLSENDRKSHFMEEHEVITHQ